MTPTPFRIHVEAHVLDDLAVRLGRTRWRAASDDDTWAHGTDEAYLHGLVHDWVTRYDWRRQEASLNQLPQFVARVGDVALHFVHLRTGGMPLLLLHGWPDSFVRYHRVAPRFAAAGYDVVIPSLPGFGFTGDVSLPPDRPNRHVARVLWRLMTEVLGASRFAIAGGDGGSVLGQIIAIDHPDSVLGLHLTDLGWHVAMAPPADPTHAERRYFERATKRFMHDGAYAAVHATQPASLAASLSDSPVGLLSWIVDRFHAWSEPDRLSTDDLLTNAMIYWVTNTIGSSIHTYFADRRSPSLGTRERVTVPVGVALFPAEPAGVPPRQLAERTLAVARWTEMPRGGHFAALEEPELYANDVMSFLRDLRTRRQEARHDHPGL